MSRPLSDGDLLARLVAFDTTSRNSNLALADFLAGYVEDRRQRRTRSVVRNASADGTKANLLVRIGPALAADGDTAARGLVLSGHMDVVPAEEDGWTSDPFTLTDRGDRWVARGSADMKGFLALAANLAREAAPHAASLGGAAGARLHLRRGGRHPGRPPPGRLAGASVAGAIGPLPRAAVIGEPTEPARRAPAQGAPQDALPHHRAQRPQRLPAPRGQRHRGGRPRHRRAVGAAPRARRRSAWRRRTASRRCRSPPSTSAPSPAARRSTWCRTAARWRSASACCRGWTRQPSPSGCARPSPAASPARRGCRRTARRSRRCRSRRCRSADRSTAAALRQPAAGDRRRGADPPPPVRRARPRTRRPASPSPPTPAGWRGWGSTA